MSDYSFVRDVRQEITGFWIRDRTLANDRERLSMLVMAALMKEGIPDFQVVTVDMAITNGIYRVVPNKYDKAGGCFVMLADATVPGESKKKPWWKFW